MWLPIALAGQSISLDSVPTHWTLSSQIDPVPAPKTANETAVAPEENSMKTDNCSHNVRIVSLEKIQIN